MRADPSVLRALNGSVVVLATVAVIVGLAGDRSYVALLALPAFPWGVLGVVYPRFGPTILTWFV